MAFNPNEHLMQIKSSQGSKDYLEVKWRLVWFRDKFPNGSIETEMLHLDLDRETEEEVYAYNPEKRKSEKVLKRASGFVIFKATVKDGQGGIGTGTKTEKAASFPDFIEKAESGAIGRALAALGFGTQFTGDEFNEHHRIVDSPVDRQPVAPSEVEAIRSAWASAYGIVANQIDVRWPKYKVYALGQQIDDPALTSAHLAKMHADVEKQKATASNGK